MERDGRTKQEAAAVAHENARRRIVEAKKANASAGSGHPGVSAQTHKRHGNGARRKTICMVEHVDRVAGYPNDDWNPPQAGHYTGQDRRCGQCNRLGAGGKRSDVIEGAD
jgi:hypothetical protein